MRRRWIVTACVVGLAATGCGSTTTPGGVLVVNDLERVRGCRVLGTVADNEMQDLQKKASRLGGNVALLTPDRKSKGGYFGLEDYMTADVYRCEGVGLQR